MLMLHHISKSFHGQSVLRDITFRMSEGESILLLGANGAGKSTLIKIILRMLQQDHGEMEWSGIRPRIGYVPQSPSIMGNLTIRQFISYVLSLHGKRSHISTVLKDAGLDEKSKMLAENLSTGQMKRLLFRLAIAAKPKLLIMDEPTAGMDLEAKRLFRRQLSAIRADGIGILVTTHIPSEAEELTDRLLYLESGVIRVDRAIEDIRRLRQSISFRTDSKDEKLLFSLGYTLRDGVFQKLTDDADKELQLLIQRNIQLKQLEIKGETLKRYVEGLNRKGAGL